MQDDFDPDKFHSTGVQLKVTQSKCTFEVYRNGYKILLNGILRQPAPGTFTFGRGPWPEGTIDSSFLYYDSGVNVVLTSDSKARSSGFMHISKTGTFNHIYLSIFGVCSQCGEEEYHVPFLTISEKNANSPSLPGRYIVNSPIIETQQIASPPTPKQ
ncbi:MAG TPA: hypothetical protein PKC79_11740 [Solidesulfovibrio magneticus]|nr:hypothetical protein [Solidesulfovibrio magneticus]